MTRHVIDTNLKTIFKHLAQLKMILIGLTGGIAAGKSTVSKIFSETHSVTVVDADQIARLGS